MQRRGRSRVIGALVVGAGAVLSWLEWLASPNADPAVLKLDLVSGWAFLGAAGLIASSPNAVRLAALWAATGLAWFLGAIVGPLGWLFLGFLAHALLTHPDGRLGSREQRLAIAVGYAVALLSAQLLLASAEAAVMALVAVVGVRRAVGSRGRQRRAAAAATIAAAAIGTTVLVAGLGLANGWIDVSGARVATAIATILATLGLAADLRWGGWSQDVIARLVIDLGDRAEATTLRERLADAMDDPSLVIGYGIDGDASFVDEAGRPIDIPRGEGGRTVVPLAVGGSDVAVLIRDGRAPVDPLLVDGVAGAAQLAIRNARLHADARRQLAELEASRARLIAAADGERIRIRSELDDGALRRLTGVHARLAGMTALGGEHDRLAEHAASVIEQLTELSAGLGPASFLGEGLAPALRRVASMAPVPVEVEIAVRSVPPALEAGAYYVCSEGLANVVKHARATRAHVRVTETSDRLIVEVADDGVGGADPSAGSGLRGLRDRIETMGGRLTTDSPAGGGTRLRAELPMPSGAAEPAPRRGPAPREGTA